MDSVTLFSTFWVYLGAEREGKEHVGSDLGEDLYCVLGIDIHVLWLNDTHFLWLIIS